MRHMGAVVCTAAVVIAWAHGGVAHGRELTLDQALDLARERAPAVVAARLAIDEARGRLTAAAVFLRENPVIDSAAGPRFLGDGSESLEARLGLSQGIELGGRRGARVAAAEAGVARSGAEADEAVRVALFEVATAFYRALHAAQSADLIRRTDAVAVDIVRIAERRLGAGDVADLDVSLAKAARSRTAAALTNADARRAATAGELQALLSLAPPITVVVSGVLQVEPSAGLDTLESRAVDRPDLRALEAQVREAEADAQLGRAAQWPEVSVGAEYERDQNDDIALARLNVSLPVFERGQGLRAEALARAARLRAELDARRRAISTMLATAYDVYRRRSAAAEELVRVALPLQEDNEVLARRAYETGQLGLVEWLIVRREILDARQESLDRSLDAALAAVDLQFHAGLLR